MLAGIATGPPIIPNAEEEFMRQAIEQSMRSFQEEERRRKEKKFMYEENDDDLEKALRLSLNNTDSIFESSMRTFQEDEERRNNNSEFYEEDMREAVRLSLLHSNTYIDHDDSIEEEDNLLHSNFNLVDDEPVPQASSQKQGDASEEFTFDSTNDIDKPDLEDNPGSPQLNKQTGTDNYDNIPESNLPKVIEDNIGTEEELNQPTIRDESMNQPTDRDDVLNKPTVRDGSINQPEARDESMNQPKVRDGSINQPEARDDSMNQPKVSDDSMNQPEAKDDNVNQPKVRDENTGTEHELNPPTVRDESTDNSQVNTDLGTINEHDNSFDETDSTAVIGQNVEIRSKGESYIPEISGPPLPSPWISANNQISRLPVVGQAMVPVNNVVKNAVEPLNPPEAGPSQMVNGQPIPDSKASAAGGVGGVTQQMMNTVFKKGLEAKLNAKEMEPCKVIFFSKI